MHRHNIEKVKAESVLSSVCELDKMLTILCPKADSEEINVISTIPGRRKNHIYGKKGDYVPKHLKHQVLPNESVVTETMEFEGVEARSNPSHKLISMITFGNYVHLSGMCCKEAVLGCLDTCHYVTIDDTQRF